ncbi:hypothetical protein VDGE_30222 [Verticillium dahliae]|uniref:Zn(2)-C6 fungal-type domain-containing protein n=1 Tax=Verticillium dahliae TaxID=27337 RepID=A0A444RTN0_VERDA|nr:hypothetical protein VDGE_30222 [Verticillium dahliae]
MLRQDSRPSLAIPKTRVSKRAAVACTAFACSLRKVRCTVALSGPPCANCAVDDTPCEISRRKRRRNLDLQPSLAHASGNEEASSAASTSSFSRVPIALPPATFASPSVKESSRLDRAAQPFNDLLQTRDSGGDAALRDSRKAQDLPHSSVVTYVVRLS